MRDRGRDENGIAAFGAPASDPRAAAAAAAWRRLALRSGEARRRRSCTCCGVGEKCPGPTGDSRSSRLSSHCVVDGEGTVLAPRLEYAAPSGTRDERVGMRAPWCRREIIAGGGRQPSFKRFRIAHSQAPHRHCEGDAGEACVLDASTSCLRRNDCARPATAIARAIFPSAAAMPHISARTARTAIAYAHRSMPDSRASWPSE